MNAPLKKQTLIIVAGPTAVGKTAMGIKLANYFNTEIISTDSRQIYKELTIGTAKPSPEELSQAKHHFINHISIHEPYSAGKFETEALECLDRIFKENDVAIAVGGAGLYAEALCYGLNDMPEVAAETRAELQNMLDNEGIETLQDLVKKYDPDFYQTTDIKNPRRLIRALEVFRTTGKPFSSYRLGTKANRNFKMIWVGLELDRQLLNERINKRVDIMMEAGLKNEALNLIEYKEHNALKTVGYQEFYDWKEGVFPFDQAVDKIKINSRRYAKRQMTWFKKNEEIKWFAPNDFEDIITFVTREV